MSTSILLPWDLPRADQSRASTPMFAVRGICSKYTISWDKLRIGWTRRIGSSQSLDLRSHGSELTTDDMRGSELVGTEQISMQFIRSIGSWMIRGM
jgi:hypothetical protein